MKRNFFMMAFVCLFTVVALSSCSKDDDDENGKSGSIPDNTITATVENGNSYNSQIDIVKAEIWDYSTGESHVLASAEYKDGGFKLVLPASVGSQYLELLDEEDIPAGITVSNKNVKSASVYELDAYKSGDRAGWLYNETGNWEGSLMYVDGDVTVTGTETDTDSWEDSEGTHTETWIIQYSVNLKKGWNMVYIKETESGNTETIEVTTTAPAGAKWYFEPYSNGSYDESSVSGSRVRTPFLSSKQKIRSLNIILKF
jgi:hypothetical protein